MFIKWEYNYPKRLEPYIQKCRDQTMISLQFLTMIESKIYWVYCDYSLLEAPWSTLLAMLDLHICLLIVQPSPAPTDCDYTLSITSLNLY